jgi:hypothetical protein
MFRIKCNNGKYVSKTSHGNWVSFTKGGKVWHSKNLVEKNLEWCKKWAERELVKYYGNFEFEIEELKTPY